MKLPKYSGRLVAEIRTIIGRSQAQFATMIGVSKDTIISVENGRNGLSSKLAGQIQEATGANLLEQTLQSPFKVANYTRDDFARWCRDHNEAAAGRRFEEMSPWLKIIFVASAKAGSGGNRNRLPGVCLSFRQWLKDTRQKFKLEKEMEDLTEDETRRIGRIGFSIESLLENPDNAKKDLGEHGIVFGRIKKQLEQHATRGWLIVEDEFRDVWTSSGAPYQVVCSTRKKLRKAKCWIKCLPPVSPVLHDFDHLTKVTEEQLANVQALIDGPESEILPTKSSRSRKSS